MNAVLIVILYQYSAGWIKKPKGPQFAHALSRVQALVLGSAKVQQYPTWLTVRIEGLDPNQSRHLKLFVFLSTSPKIVSNILDSCYSTVQHTCRAALNTSTSECRHNFFFQNKTLQGACNTGYILQFPLSLESVILKQAIY